jgi:hypothetical protein
LLRNALTSLTFNNCIFWVHCIFVFCIYLRTNSDFCHIHHKLIGFYNPVEKCLQRGTNFVSKLSSLRFVFKRLMRVYIISKCIDTYIRKDIGLHIHTYTHTYIHIRTGIHTYMHSSTHTHVGTYIRSSVHIYIHTYIRTYVGLRLYVITYIHMYIHTHFCPGQL